jgi:two-component system cell cycle response regulator CtrA
VFICKLRKKIAAATGGSHYIETVWGRGYVLKDPEVQAEPAQGGEGAPMRLGGAQAAVA